MLHDPQNQIPTRLHTCQPCSSEPGYEQAPRTRGVLWRLQASNSKELIKTGRTATPIASFVGRGHRLPSTAGGNPAFSYCLFLSSVRSFGCGLVLSVTR